MTTAEAWATYMRLNARANRAYDTREAELAHRAIPTVERNRAKSKRFYADKTKREARA